MKYEQAQARVLLVTLHKKDPTKLHFSSCRCCEGSWDIRMLKDLY